MKFKHSLKYTEQDFENLQKTITTLANGFGTIVHKVIDNHERARVQEENQRHSEKLLQTETNRKIDVVTAQYEEKVKSLQEQIERLERLVKRDNSPMGLK